MTEGLNDEFASFVPDFNTTPQAPHYHDSLANILGGAAVPFGFSEQHSTPVVDDGLDHAARELRTNHKINEDGTSSEYLPF